MNIIKKIIDYFFGWLLKGCEIEPIKNEYKTGRYSKEEEAVLIELLKDGLTVEEIAIVLNRKPSSVYNKIYKLQKKGVLEK